MTTATAAAEAAARLLEIVGARTPALSALAVLWATMQQAVTRPRAVMSGLDHPPVPALPILLAALASVAGSHHRRARGLLGLLVQRVAMASVHLVSAAVPVAAAANNAMPVVHLVL